MEDIELIDIWKAYNQKIDEAKVLNLQSWAVNIKTFEYLQTHKAQSKLRSVASFKKWAIVIGIIWLLFLGVLAYGNHFQNVYFTSSVIAIMFFTIIAIATYIKHVVLINQINYSESIVDTQKKLTALQASTINVFRILWLQLPFYSTFFWNKEWITTDVKFWLIAFPLTLFFVFLAIWLYRNIQLKNANKKWFKILLGDKEWASIIIAKKYLDEIEEFKKG
jgi:hypothetical protein